MKKDYFLISKEIANKKKKYFKNFNYYGKKIKKIAEKILGKGVKVLIFGSSVKGNWSPKSDIDVLIISENLSKNWEENLPFKVNIKKSLGSFSPFQIHLALPEEYENWYKKFIKNDFIEIL